MEASYSRQWLSVVVFHYIVICVAVRTMYIRPSLLIHPASNNMLFEKEEGTAHPSLARPGKQNEAPSIFPTLTCMHVRTVREQDLPPYYCKGYLVGYGADNSRLTCVSNTFLDILSRGHDRSSDKSERHHHEYPSDGEQKNHCVSSPPYRQRLSSTT